MRNEVEQPVEAVVEIGVDAVEHGGKSFGGRGHHAHSAVLPERIAAEACRGIDRRSAHDRAADRMPIEPPMRLADVDAGAIWPATRW